MAPLAAKYRLKYNHKFIIMFVRIIIIILSSDQIIYYVGDAPNIVISVLII